MRDDSPFGGPDPPAALFRYSRNRSGDHPVEHLRVYAGKLNDIDPQAWLVDVLARIAEMPQSRLHELLPWKWQEHSRHDQAV